MERNSDRIQQRANDRGVRMDFIFTITGAVCIAEAVMMLIGKDMMIFNENKIKKEDYDVKRLFKVESLLFFLDGLGFLALGMLGFDAQTQLIIIGALVITLMFHAKNFSSDHYKVKKDKR